MTLDFVVQHLYKWKSFSFWNQLHKKLVKWNIELRIKDGGTGLIPHWRLAHASFAASWFQPLSTMAQAKQISEVQLLNDLNECEGFLSIQMLKDSLGKVGYDDDLLNVYNAFHEALKEEVFKQVAKKQKELGEADQLAASVIEAIEKRVRDSFRWQKFLSKDILKNHAQNFVDASSKSNLPFANFELARIVDRRDPFARRIFLISLVDHRTRVIEQTFLLARAYFTVFSSEVVMQVIIFS